MDSQWEPSTDLAYEIGIGFVSPSAFSTETSSGRNPCCPCACCHSLFETIYTQLLLCSESLMCSP